MTHAELVARAERWLHSNGCGVVFTELVTHNSETPDAIGFRCDTSILVEAKTSRSDFFADRKKPHRNGTGMGDWRFYLCEPGIIRPTDLPLDWGLLYVEPRRVKRVAGGPESNNWHTAARRGDKAAEMRMMYSALRRLHLRGLMKHIYEPFVEKVNVDELLRQREAA